MLDMHRRFLAATSSAALLFLPGTAVGAQERPPEAPSLAELRLLIDEQRVLLAEQKKQLDEQGRAIAELQRKTEGIAELPKPGEPAGAPAVETRLAQVEQELHKLPELEKTTVTAGDFPGSFRIPGTDTAIRVGGMVRMVSVRTFDALGSEDRFVTSSIPVTASEAAGKGDRTTYSALPSRFHLDLRTPTKAGAMRAFVEGDFFGPGNAWRLRHAYGQSGKFLLGQTWSTFSDPEAQPSGIDHEGLNAISLFRQAQFRFTQPLGERLALSIAAENPAPDISTPSGGPVSGVNQVPDTIVRLRWTPGQKTVGSGLVGNLMRGEGHVQAAFLFRQVRGEDLTNNTLSTLGVGAQLSGRLRSPWQRDRDRILFAIAGGTGIGRYITDLRTLGGQDAVYDPATNTLEALPVASAYVGYEHWWSRTVRTTATWGTVVVDNLEVQTGDAFQRTDRASLNLSWSPIPRLDLVGEFLWGRRIDKNGQRGEATQAQFGTSFRF